MDNYSKVGFYAAWNIDTSHGKYFALNMHAVYIDYMCRKFDNVVLITTCKPETEHPTGICLSNYSNLEIVSLPYSARFIDSLKQIKHFYNVFKSCKGKIDILYCRTPDPFSWMPRLCFGYNTIMDFVGDTIHCTWHNENWNVVKKILMIAGYLPDYFLTLISATQSKVTTAGGLLKKRLRKFGIKATDLIPSTITSADIPLTLKRLSTNPISFSFVGFLRYAKGINCLMEFILLLKNDNINFRFNLIGDGEMRDTLLNFISEHKLQDKVSLYGHIENRSRINEILHDSDIFFFPSLSEGAPRVVIEAMAQGAFVLSTPVGSLPYSFVDGETIRFFDFNNAIAAKQVVDNYISNIDKYTTMRDAAFAQVKDNYTVESFIDKLYQR